MWLEAAVPRIGMASPNMQNTRCPGANSTTNHSSVVVVIIIMLFCYYYY